MKFGAIGIRGFGSVIEPMVYNFDSPGLNILAGKNGVGKTTFFNALAWCLYKQVLKKDCTVEPWPWLLPDNFQGTLVVQDIIDGKDTYQIMRGLNCKVKFENTKIGNRLIVLKNKAELKELRGATAAKKFIEGLVGYSWDLFKNAILFGQGMERLNQASGPDKKRLFDEAFEVAYINQARDTTSKTLNQLHEQDALLEVEISGSTKTINQLTETLKSVEEATSLFEKTRRDKLHGLKEKKSTIIKELIEAKKFNKKITGAKGQFDHLHEQMVAIDETIDGEISNKIFKAEMEINSLQGEIETIELKLVGLRNEYQIKVCGNCGQKLNPKTLKDIRTRIKGQMSEFKESRRLKGITLGLMKGEFTKLKDIERDNGVRQYQVDSLWKKIAEVQKLITDKIDLGTLRERLKNTKERIIEVKAEQPQKIWGWQNLGTKIEIERALLKGLVEKAELIKKNLDIQQWLLKDPLSNSGLKAFIFDSMLGKLNSNLAQYENSINMRIKVYVEMSSANKDIMISVYKDNKEVPYNDLSGGQKQLANVALCFGVNDTVNENKPLPILLMDEIFESLDAENVEIVGNMIVEKSLQRSIHLITHHSKFAPSNSKITKLELNKKGYTQVA